MAETSTTSIRLTEQDRANADTIIATGAVTDMASAIRLGLALTAHFFHGANRSELRRLVARESKRNAR